MRTSKTQHLGGMEYCGKEAVDKNKKLQNES